MKFPNFREFKKKFATWQEMAEYMSAELNKNFKELGAGMSKHITFDEQFKSFKTTVTIPAGKEAIIPNRLSGIPTEWSVMDATGTRNIIKSPTNTWTSQSLFLKNVDSVAGTITVRFWL